MKKFLGFLLAVLLILGLSSFAADHFRADLYRLAIQFETGRAGLIAKSEHIHSHTYYYLERSDTPAKETIILLHGFSADKYNWLRFAQAIPEHYQIIAMDLLGHGEHSIDLQQDYHIETQVAYLHAFLSRKFNTPLHLVGNSMGGAIASLYAAKFPDQVKSLTLISPAGVHTIPSVMENMLENKQVNPLIADSIEQFYQVVDFVMEDPPYIPTPVLKVQAERAVHRVALNHKIFTDIREDLHKNLQQNFRLIQAPTLIIWGQQDRVINAENLELYADLIPNATTRLLQGIGHLAMLETPAVTASAFLKHADHSLKSVH